MWQTDAGPRFDLLASFGADAYHAEDAGLFSDDPGTGAVLPCAGVRAGVWYRFDRRGRGRFLAGLFASYERDFGRVTRRYSYLERSLFGSEPQLRESQYTFGDRRFPLGVSLGLGFQ